MSGVESPPEIPATWASTLRRSGLAAPMAALLELQKPLSFSIGQFLLVGQPLLSLFVPSQFTNQLIHLFSDRQELDRFLKQLEDSEPCR